MSTTARGQPPPVPHPPRSRSPIYTQPIYTKPAHMPISKPMWCRAQPQGAGVVTIHREVYTNRQTEATDLGLMSWENGDDLSEKYVNYFFFGHVLMLRVFLFFQWTRIVFLEMARAWSKGLDRLFGRTIVVKSPVRHKLEDRGMLQSKIKESFGVIVVLLIVTMDR